MDDGRSDRARPEYRLRRLGGGSYGRVVPAEAPLSQALVKRQVRFSIPNAQERTKALPKLGPPLPFGTLL